MADYAIMKTVRIDETQTLPLDTAIKAVNSKVAGVSIIHYSEPQVVILHCDGELTPEELGELRPLVSEFLP